MFLMLAKEMKWFRPQDLGVEPPTELRQADGIEITRQRLQELGLDPSEFLRSDPPTGS